jgi:hypothetical protein
MEMNYSNSLLRDTGERHSRSNVLGSFGILREVLSHSTYPTKRINRFEPRGGRIENIISNKYSKGYMKAGTLKGGYRFA